MVTCKIQFINVTFPFESSLKQWIPKKTHENIQNILFSHKCNVCMKKKDDIAFPLLLYVYIIIIITQSHLHVSLSSILKTLVSYTCMPSQKQFTKKVILK